MSGNFGGESWKVRLQDSPLDVDPAGERERPSVSLQSSGDFLKMEQFKKAISILEERVLKLRASSALLLCSLYSRELKNCSSQTGLTFRF